MACPEATSVDTPVVFSKKLLRNLGPPPPGPAPPPPVSAAVGANLAANMAPVAPVAAVGAAATLHDDSGWNTGGTGGTVDFGWNSEVVIRMMAKQAQMMAAVQSAAAQQRDEASAVGTASEVLAQPADDEVGQRLEEMVEELAGVHSLELLEDAFSKVDAAREALSQVIHDSSGLRHSAPAFVPGQMWTGRQRSSFVD